MKGVLLTHTGKPDLIYLIPTEDLEKIKNKKAFLVIESNIKKLPRHIVIKQNEMIEVEFSVNSYSHDFERSLEEYSLSYYSHRTDKQGLPSGRLKIQIDSSGKEPVEFATWNPDKFHGESIPYTAKIMKIINIG